VSSNIARDDFRRATRIIVKERGDVGRSGNLKSHLTASCVRNICAKNRQNPLLLFKVTIDNVGVPFY